MNNQQVQNFFYDKKDTPCPITESLIKSGYQQEREGYIAYAKEHGVEVNYLEAKPTQWWHLIECYCAQSDPLKPFPYSVKCGELYFWMAEVSGAFSQEELLKLKDQAMVACDRVTRKNHSLPPLKTAKGNLIIREYCFDRICEVIERV